MVAVGATHGFDDFEAKRRVAAPLPTHLPFAGVATLLLELL
jgi:hypothetical protein